MQLKNIAVIGVSAAIAAVGIGIGAGGSAYADSLLGSSGIKDDSVRSLDVKDGTLRLKDMKPGTATKTRNHEDTLHGLIVGAGYAGLGAHDYWAPGSYGETIETCPAGQYAIGGGFSQDASTGTDGKYDLGGKADVQVTVSAPYFKGDYEPVDDAGNFRADQWVVRGFNHSDKPVDVRAWVVCSSVS